MRQLALVPAGSHANNCGAIANSHMFAWCSRFAIYVADLDAYLLRHIIAEHSEPITCIDWSSHQPRYLVSASADHSVRVWDVQHEATVFTLLLDSIPLFVQWCRGSADTIAIASANGTVRFWHPTTSKSLVSRDFSFSPVKVLRWSLKVASLLAAGHEDCSISIYNTADQASHRIKCFDSKFGGHTGGVVDLQWDPLSDNYLIAAFGSGQIALFDARKKEHVRSFDKSPGGCRCLEWLPTALIEP